MEAEALLIPIVLIILWGFAYRYSSLVSGAQGRSRFWIFLITSLVIGALSFLILVVPELDCKGGLCILGPVLIWGAINFILQIILPAWLIAGALRTYKKRQKKD